MNNPILTPMKHAAAASLVALLALGPLSGHAWADAIPASCMSTSSSSRTMGAASLAMTGYNATLSGNSAHLTVQQLTARDRNEHFTLPNLRDANALISFGLLKLVHNGSPAGCKGVDGRPALATLRQALHKGAVAELSWNKVSLSEGSTTYTADRLNATLRAGQTPGSVEIIYAASGLGAPGGSALPHTLHTTVTIPEDMLDSSHTPNGRITITALNALWAKGQLDGNGWVTPGRSAGTSEGELHLAITDLSDLLATIRPVLPTGVSTALSVAQFMGHRDGNRVTWDLTLSNGTLKVNSIPIPVN
ncbi:DUF2125 domain-containing protein [Asaia lannensis]|uniref:DUF2125 domain-containing protein n=1 Tax=Asaia lannensis NBRC 102526 TaxID=1307926 RepID=A0ABT1CH78_9PROT|nr:DUF2125 domain-containing protein [Asaia lannensis]MCO6159553.1 DUF2125 domain-containing protein [Asaia lannensis NBRC 102526]GBQ98653.1 hypothetical protein AA102526_1547 [Asaia lannensis NBRC 102526]